MQFLRGGYGSQSPLHDSHLFPHNSLIRQVQKKYRVGFQLTLKILLVGI